MIYDSTSELEVRTNGQKKELRSDACLLAVFERYPDIIYITDFQEQYRHLEINLFLIYYVIILNGGGTLYNN